MANTQTIAPVALENDPFLRSTDGLNANKAPLNPPAQSAAVLRAPQEFTFRFVSVRNWHRTIADSSERQALWLSCMEFYAAQKTPHLVRRCQIRHSFLRSEVCSVYMPRRTVVVISTSTNLTAQNRHSMRQARSVTSSHQCRAYSMVKCASPSSLSLFHVLRTCCIQHCFTCLCRNRLETRIETFRCPGHDVSGHYRIDVLHEVFLDRLIHDS